MTTNLSIDDDLIAEAQDLGNHKSKEETVTAALQEYIQRRARLKEQRKILELFGTIDNFDDFDPKELRAKK